MKLNASAAPKRDRFFPHSPTLADMSGESEQNREKGDREAGAPHQRCLRQAPLA